MKSFSRRSFLKTTALAAATAGWSARSWGQVAGANGDVRVAIAGLNGRGKNHLASLGALPGVRVVALCDPDSAVLARAAAALGGGVGTYTDIRQLLVAPGIDARVAAASWQACRASIRARICDHQSSPQSQVARR